MDDRYQCPTEPAGLTAIQKDYWDQLVAEYQSLLGGKSLDELQAGFRQPKDLAEKVRIGEILGRITIKVRELEFFARERKVGKSPPSTSCFDWPTPEELRSQIQHRRRKEGVGRTEEANEARGLAGLLENLRFGRATLFETSPCIPLDDVEFSLANPEHSMALPQRAVRQRAADRVLEWTRANPGTVGPEVLSELHEALFDRCPSVRMSVAEALGMLARTESESPLERLLDAEDESEAVTAAASRALAACRSKTSRT